jgi:hypothetical protein
VTIAERLEFLDLRRLEGEEFKVGSKSEALDGA